jgi:hypothetical protein
MAVTAAFTLTAISAAGDSTGLFSSFLFFSCLSGFKFRLLVDRVA